VIAGPVNAGKSSLFNRLADMDRAIVAASPGTTRDLLVEQIDLAGVPITLVDTAGLRSSDDEVEAEGIRRAQRAVDVAAVTVFVLDRSAPIEAVHRELLSQVTRGPAVLAANKSDLPGRWAVGAVAASASVPWVETSARTGEGLSALRDALGVALGLSRLEQDPPRVTNVRHIALLREAVAGLEAVLNDLAGLDGPPPEEVLLEGLSSARGTLEQISGVRTPEDVLAHIFERFCIGK
jgi:tRNA modification GTPase